MTHWWENGVSHDSGETSNILVINLCDTRWALSYSVLIISPCPSHNSCPVLPCSAFTFLFFPSRSPSFSTAPLKIWKTSLLGILGSASHIAKYLCWPLIPYQLWMSHSIGFFLWWVSFFASLPSCSISHLLRNFNAWHFAVVKSALLCQLIHIIQQFPILLTTSLVFIVTMYFINDHLYLLLNARQQHWTKTDTYI